MNLAIVASACLFVGVLVGFVACYFGGYTVAETRQAKERARQEEIERRLLGRDAPKHRATSEPAVVRSARMARSKLWSN